MSRRKRLRVGAAHGVGDVVVAGTVVAAAAAVVNDHRLRAGHQTEAVTRHEPVTSSTETFSSV